MNVPIRLPDPCKTTDRVVEEALDFAPRIYAPQGHDAPRHSIEWANYTAASIAAREVRGKAIHSAEHRASLEAWERGERSWPWPDPTPEETARADAAVLGMVEDFTRIVKGAWR